MDKLGNRIGISGGTFDPVHNGHLITAQYTMEKLELNKVIFIPSGKPPHKTRNDITSSEHRFNMVSEACERNSCFEASKIEMERPGKTYTIDTLKQIKSMYGDLDIFYITGADVIRDIKNWKDFEKVFELCDFIAAIRPNYDKDSFMQDVKLLKSKYQAKIHVIDVPLIEISSTEIRNRIKKGLPIKYLVPQKVEKYIMENKLYK